MVNVRDEVLKDIQSYNNRCISQGKESTSIWIKTFKMNKMKVFRCLLTLIVPILEKQSVEKIEKLQQCMFKTLSDGFQSILDEENQILLDTER